MEHLLLLHGAIGAKEQFIPLAEKLKSNYNVHTLNFSGHGGEPMPERFSIEVFANDVLNYLDKNSIDKVNIFGYSMGGYVAMYLAKNYPTRISKVMTLATKFLWTEAIAEKEIKMLNAEKIQEKLPEFAKILEDRNKPNDWKLALKATAEIMIALGKNNTLQLSDYEAIEHQTLISIGDKDTMVTLEETIAVYRQIKNANFLVLPNTQHPIEKVKVERISSEIKSFFN
jgi:esterase/lipase